ncbi:MAG TPA: hypothetical protein VK970_18950 [Candidatus Methylacidiphilales bacterium]|nr:hypothetical protein [Candidatus Methylacidiphilales bacterium]
MLTLLKCKNGLQLLAAWAMYGICASGFMVAPAMIHAADSAAATTAEADPYAAYGTLVPEAKEREYQRQFRQRQTSTRTLSAGLSQRLYMRGVRRPVISTARVAYEAPASFAVRYIQPEGEYLILRKGHLELQRRGKPLVVKDIGRGDGDMSKAGPLMLLDLFRDGGASYESGYDVSMRESGGRLTVILQAKGGGGSRPSLIRTTLSLPSLELVEIDVTFSDQNRITYGFSSIQRNGSLDAGAFVSGETKH